MIQFCPEVRPTLKEFNDFYLYTEYLQKTYSAQYAMVKVIPPKNWKPRKGEYQSLQNMIIPGPIQQNTYGKGGAYQCLHMQKKSMSIRQYKKRTNCFEHMSQGLQIQQIQKLFWKNISFSPPLYGADIKASFMDQTAGAWNLNNLKSVLSSGLCKSLPGVNTPYCYVGSWKTLFCWHTQDMQLSAINFLHFGKPKFWYGICHTDRQIFQKQAKNYFNENYQKCSEYLRHKTYIINPYIIKAKHKQIKIHKIIQNAGEFVLTFGSSYHCGFNFGYNFAEAVNYATLSWLKIFNKVQYCNCRRDSVKVSKEELSHNLMNSEYKQKEQVIEFLKQIKQQQEQVSIAQNQQQVSKSNKKDENLKLAKILKRKLIKKKSKSSIKIKGENYKIQTWAQCQLCKKWRKIDKKIKKDRQFSCESIGKHCNMRQESNSEYIVLPKN